MLKCFSYFVAVLTVLSNGQAMKKEDIINKTIDDYVDTFCDDLFKMIESGRYNRAEKTIQWVFIPLKDKGFIERVYKAHYRITDAGMEFLKVLPYHLDAWLERELDMDCTVLSGKAFYDLRKIDDGSTGAKYQAAYVRNLIKQIEDGADKVIKSVPPKVIAKGIYIY